MEIDVREKSDRQAVTSIRFGDAMNDIVRLHCSGSLIEVCPTDEGQVCIEDIDNLILALEKAKEVCG